MAGVFDPCLRRLMAQTINVAPYAGASAYGDPTYAAATAAKARVEPTSRLFYDASGEERRSEFAIYTEQLVGDLDRVWLPGDSPTDATKARNPLKVYQGIDEDGSVSHYEVFV